MTEPAKRYLALDVGERRTGLAGTDPSGTICVPLKTLVHNGMAVLPERLVPIVAEREPEVIVVGIPFSADGSIGPQAKKILRVVDLLRARFPDVGIETVDESETTNEAHRLLKEAGIKAARRKKQADSIAALTILRRHIGC